MGISKKLTKLVKSLETKFGQGAVVPMDGSGALGVAVVSSGSLGLDRALGIGGLPKGRIVEIYGPEAGGKTTMALHALAEVQRAGGVAGFVDAEHALDPSYAARIGVKVDEMIVSQPDCGEQGLQITEALCQSGAVDLVVVDSVAALTPRAEIDGDIGDQHVGLQARLMSHALRKLTATAAKAGTTVIFIHQLRTKIGVMFGSPETTTGGNALKFYSSVRLDVRRKGSIKEGEEIVGNRVRVKVAKNKLAPPFRQAEFDLIFGLGVHRAGEILDAALEAGQIRKAGAWFSYGDERIGQGRRQAAAWLEAHPEEMEALRCELLAPPAEAPAEAAS